MAHSSETFKANTYSGLYLTFWLAHILNAFQYILDHVRVYWWVLIRVRRVEVFDFGTGRVGYLQKSSGTGTGRVG